MEDGVSGDIMEIVQKAVVQDINLDLELVPTQLHLMVEMIATEAKRKL